jgi:basic membrane protein A
MIRIYIFVVCFLVFQFAAQANNLPTNQPLKVGFMMCGTAIDQGWNQAHNEGRLYLEKQMNGKVRTILAERAPENAESVRVMEKMIAQGVKVIFATSYGYLDSVLKVAKRHPDVIFMQSNRLNKEYRKNVGGYFVFYFEPMYVAGIVAGRMTKTNHLGFIAGHNVPSVLNTVNAFMLGAKSVNPKIKLHLVCTNSWDDPSTETEATKALIENGSDIISSNLNTSLTVCKAAEKYKGYCIGTHYDCSKIVPDVWLVGQTWNRGPLYVKIVKEIMDGTWQPKTNYYSAKDNLTTLSSFGAMVSSKVKQEALNVLEKIRSGKLEVYSGPLKDNQGKTRLAAGKIADGDFLEQMNWVVPGVEGLQK